MTTLNTDELRKVAKGLGFVIENRSGFDVLSYLSSGCRPATPSEMAMWQSILALLDRIAALEAEREADKARVAEMKAALDNIAAEAERPNGGWVHLKRVIGNNARQAMKGTQHG